MRQMVNGRVMEIPTDRDGSFDSDVLRKIAGVPRDRPLILQSEEGNEFINPGKRVKVEPGRFFVDAPVHRRG